MKSLALSALCAALLVPGAAQASAPAKSHPARRRPSAPPPALVWHVETLAGAEVDSNRADEPVNPASVVKVATSWWALDRLGPEHQFETSFYARGAVDPRTGVLNGDLVVSGSGDPDFQAENAFLVAAALNDLGVRRVKGGLVVNRAFWTGWENGSEGMEPDPDRRARLMGERLRANLDPHRWGRAAREAWYDYARRHGLRGVRPPGVAVAGPVLVEDRLPRDGDVALVDHHSKPLLDVLRRFNCFSNNDIERIGADLGSPADLSRALSERVAAGSQGIQLETTSGLGENRLTPRQIVALLREFRKTVEARGLSVESVLPVSGCEPSTVTHFFPAFSRGENAMALAAKTGTLHSTDGGVSALAGFMTTSRGELVFAVAAPRNGGRVKTSRAVEQRWLLDLVKRFGGGRPRSCGSPLAEPDAGASVVVFRDAVSSASASATPAAPAPASRNAPARSGVGGRPSASR